MAAAPEIPGGTPTGTTGSDGLATFTTIAVIGLGEILINDRLTQINGLDYTISGSTITFLAPNIPLAGSVLRIYYNTALPPPPSGAAGVTTLLKIRTAARQQSDMTSSQFVTDAEFNSYINSSYQELYGLITQKFGNDYFIAGTPDDWFQFLTDGVSSSYPLPDGTGTYVLKDGSTVAPAFFKLLGVDLQVAPTSGQDGWLTIKPFPFVERNRFSFPNVQAAYGRRTSLRYRVNGNRIWITPVPSGGQNIRLFYVPRFAGLVNDTDSLDGVNGWEEYVIIDAAIKAKDKEESDVSVLMARKAEIVRRMESEAENRDAGSPSTVGDSRRYNGSYGGDGGGEMLG